MQPSVLSMVCAWAKEATLFIAHYHAAFNQWYVQKATLFIAHCHAACSPFYGVCKRYEATLFIAQYHAAFSPFYGVCRRLWGYLIHCKLSCSLRSFLPGGLGIRIQPTFALVRVVRELIKGYELSYATGSLNAGSSCIRWGIWVWTVGHWVVRVQVIYCSIGKWVLFLKEPTASLRGVPELQP